jgi:hypothetical protein
LFNHEALLHQDHQRQGATLACNPLAVLPGMKNDADRLKEIVKGFDFFLFLDHNDSCHLSRSKMIII